MTNSTRQAAHPTRTDAHQPATAAIFPTGQPWGVENLEAAEQSPLADPGDPLTDRVAYSVAEAALITGLSRDLLYDQMRIGKLSYLKVGRRRIITRRNLEAFLESLTS